MSLAVKRKLAQRILIVEDDTICQQVALGIIKRLGFTADIASNGREALKALGTTPYALVFMDCHMPEMDGYEASRIIRDPDSSVLNHLVPIIALTANDRVEDRQICIKAGMDDYLSKPISHGIMKRAIHHWIGKKHDKGYVRACNDNQPEPFNPDTVSEIFNYQTLLDLLTGDKIMADTILKAFIDDLDNHIIAIAASVREGDLSKTAACAHNIKGAAGNIGAGAVHGLAQEMETAARKNSTEKVNTLEPKFISLVEKTRKAIISFML